MKVSIHTASHVDTRLAVGRVRDRDRVRVRVMVRVRISYSQASRVYQPRMAIHTSTSEASRVYTWLWAKLACISRLHQGVDWLPYEEDVHFSRPQYSQYSNLQL